MLVLQGLQPFSRSNASTMQKENKKQHTIIKGDERRLQHVHVEMMKAAVGLTMGMHVDTVILLTIFFFSFETAHGWMWMDKFSILSFCSLKITHYYPLV
jgi:hypothetical protein